jgi:hypothetical protein
MRKYTWPLILFLKIVITRLNWLEYISRNLGLFSPGPGRLGNPERPIKTFLDHYSKAEKYFSSIIQNVIEIGPGETDLSMIAAAKKNINNFVLIDVQPCRRSIKNLNYDKYANFINKEDYLNALIKSDNGSFQYLDSGISALENIQDNSVDFIYSHSVLQHIKLDQIETTISHISRVSREGAIHSHYIDLKDCFSNSFNNLRFSNKLWESELVKSSGFYTNRIRLKEWMYYFDKYNLEIINYEKKNHINQSFDIEKTHNDLSHIVEASDLLLSGINITTISRKGIKIDDKKKNK